MQHILHILCQRRKWNHPTKSVLPRLDLLLLVFLPSALPPLGRAFLFDATTEETAVPPVVVLNLLAVFDVGPPILMSSSSSSSLLRISSEERKTLEESAVELLSLKLDECESAPLLRLEGIILVGNLEGVAPPPPMIGAAADNPREAALLDPSVVVVLRGYLDPLLLVG